MSVKPLHGSLQHYVKHVPSITKYAAITTFICDVFILSALVIIISTCLWIMASYPVSMDNDFDSNNYGNPSDCIEQDWNEQNVNLCLIPICMDNDIIAGFAYCKDHSTIHYDDNGAITDVTYKSNNYWSYSIIFIPFYIFNGFFYAALISLITIIIFFIIPILTITAILLLIMAAFAWILGMNYQYFFNIISNIYHYFKQRIIIYVAYLLTYFVWKRYSILFVDVAFIVGQIACSINLIVFLSTYELKKGCTCSIYSESENNILWNPTVNLLINQKVLIYFIIPYIILAFMIFISRSILNRIYKNSPANYHYNQYNTFKSQTKQLVFLVLFVQ